MLTTRAGFLTTREGRRIAFSAAGPRDGLPVVYLHGGIGTPLQRAPQLDALISRLQIRHVTIARPGFGDSDPAPDRRITDFPDDLERVVDHLQLERVVLVGVSSGGPYALASVLALQDRVAATGLVSCLSPHRAPHDCRAMTPHLRRGLQTVVRHPELVERAAGRLLGFLERHPRTAARLTMLGASGADRRQLADAAIRDTAISSFLHAASAGVSGMIADYRLCCGPWGFDVAAVDAQIHLWHGADDEFVPLEHARRLAATLRNCHVTIGTDDGHFFYRRRMDEVLTTLVAGARAREAAAWATAAPLRAAA